MHIHDRRGLRLSRLFTVADLYDVESVDTVEDQQAMLYPK